MGSSAESKGPIDERAAAIIGLRYGRVDGRKWTLDEVAAHFGLTRERVRHIEAVSLRAIGAGAQVSYRLERTAQGWLPPKDCGHDDD